MKEQKIFGRKEEIEKIKKSLSLKKSTFFVVYGRRRVGKTFLINKILSEQKNYLKLTGSFNSEKKTIFERTKIDIRNFLDKINLNIDYEKLDFKDWNGFFDLIENIAKILKERNEDFILFIDELPWFADKKGKFLTAFSLSWNQTLVDCENVKLFVSGSATTWLIEKIIKNKGGLHRRITDSINLKPFNYYESSEYLDYYGSFTEYQKLIHYFIFGGIPYYLSLYDFSLDIQKNVENLFSNQLKDEFDELTSSLFSLKGKHRELLYFLLSPKTREEIKIEFKKDKSHQTLMDNLNELVECGFVKEIKQHSNKTKSDRFKVNDCFIYFYLKNDIKNINLTSNEFNKWCGFAFENFLDNQINIIKDLLKISGIKTIEYGWNSKMDKNGEYEKHSQIDLILERNDNKIHIIEAKFYDDVFNITEEYRKNLINKRNNFLSFLERKKINKKEVNIIIVSLFGTKYNLSKPLNYIDLKLIND